VRACLGAHPLARAARRLPRAAGKRVPRVHTTRGFRHGANPTGASILPEGCRGRARVRNPVPRVHAGRDPRQNRPQGSGGCRKANPACTHGTRHLTRARRDAALPQLAGRRGLGVARRFVPRVHAGRGSRRGHGRRGRPAGMRGRGPGAGRGRAPRAPPRGTPAPSLTSSGQLPGSALRASHLAISRRAPMRPHPESARPRRRPPRERKPPQERGTEGQLDPSAPVTAVMCALRLRTQTRPASSAGSGSAAAPARPRCGSRVLRRGPWGCG
jgi:hypothetical protein